MALKAKAWAIYEASLYLTFWTDKFKIRKNSLNTNEKCVVLKECKSHYRDGDFSARIRRYCHDMFKQPFIPCS